MFYSWTPDGDCARVVRMLLENGAYIDQCPTIFGPLIEAAQYGLLEVTRVLIQYGANANSTCRGDDGATVTPLLEVAKLASLGTEDMYRHLRFDRELMTEDYVKRWIAEKAQPAECIAKILMESGADPELAISLVDSSMAVSSEGREACKGFLTKLGPRSEGGEKPGAT